MEKDSIIKKRGNGSFSVGRTFLYELDYHVQWAGEEFALIANEREQIIILVHLKEYWDAKKNFKDPNAFYEAFRHYPQVSIQRQGEIVINQKYCNFLPDEVKVYVSKSNNIYLFPCDREITFNSKRVENKFIEAIKKHGTKYSTAN